MIDKTTVSKITGTYSTLSYNDFKENLDGPTNYAEVIEEIMVIADAYFEAERNGHISHVHVRDAITAYAIQVSYTFYRRKGKAYSYLIALYSVLYIYEQESKNNE
jgi:hypothetical protein